MNKRMRKKRGRGEFTPLGVQIRAKLTAEDLGVYDSALDRLIVFCDANDIAISGGASPDLGCDYFAYGAWHPPRHPYRRWRFVTISNEQVAALSSFFAGEPLFTDVKISERKADWEEDAA